VLCVSCVAGCTIYDVDTLDLCTRVECDPVEDGGRMPIPSSTTSSTTTTAGAGGSTGGSAVDAGRDDGNRTTGATVTTTGAGPGSGGASGSGSGSGGAPPDAATRDAPPTSDAGPDPTAQCPSRISFSGTTSTAQHGMPQNGPTATDICPAGQALVSYALSAILPSNFMTPILGKIEPSCGAIAIVPDQGVCKIVVSPGSNLPTRGTHSNGATVERCPPNQIVVAFKGRSGRDTDQLSFGCAPLEVNKVNGSFRANIGAITFLGSVGGNGGSAFQDGCPSGQIAIGNKITDENGFIAAFGLVCATPILSP
jgi:hypothetical protein